MIIRKRNQRELRTDGTPPFEVSRPFVSLTVLELLCHPLCLRLQKLRLWLLLVFEPNIHLLSAVLPLCFSMCSNETWRMYISIWVYCYLMIAPPLCVSMPLLKPQGALQSCVTFSEASATSHTVEWYPQVGYIETYRLVCMPLSDYFVCKLN